MLLTLLIECIYLEIIKWYKVTWIFLNHVGDMEDRVTYIAYPVCCLKPITTYRASDAEFPVIRNSRQQNVE